MAKKRSRYSDQTTTAFTSGGTKKKSKVDNALESLSDLMRKREKELDEREDELRKAEQKLNAERTACYGDTSPSDVLHLNVGGKTMAVLRRTLTAVEGSMLASRFSGRWDDSIEKDENGHFFIDQEYELFEEMVNYLRHSSNETDLYPIRSPTFRCYETKNRFYRMVEFYGMTPGIYPNKLSVIHKAGGDEDDIIDMLGPLHVNAKEWCTLKVTPCNHIRTINSFEITLGSVQRVQMGWSTGGVNGFGTSYGVGDVPGSLALDLSRSCYLQNGQTTSRHGETTTNKSRNDINGLEVEEGTVIRSEDYGNKWFVNGQLIASSDKNDNTVNIPPRPSNFSFVVISVKGEIKVSAIGYQD